MQWLRQLFSREKPRIPDEMWRATLNRLPFLQRLSQDDLLRLKGLSEALLARKSFTGAGAFDLTDDIAVQIAAQACLPVLNLTLDLYDDMVGIIIYPAAFVIPQAEMDEAGVVHEWHEPVSGEALDAGGAVVLSWEDAADTDVAGYNVVIHEFAHKLDMANGPPNGFPPFLPAWHRELDAREWQQVFSGAYDDFMHRVEKLERALPEHFDDTDPAHAAMYDDLSADLPLDPYAAKHPAEFFAVASEAFFVLPETLAGAYPDVYRLLSRYYRQDPLSMSQ
ncbi:zinc-dependent peptidase [Noviherbaspirillum saxi]|uniref:Zinc-dependent peptidase n=1 Tax=Noviherbaspirillum saxi TaxID=2320863 RepID=A0A3A3FJT8_9BURK|nr:M90 family metallopeptidase [Noviherbaspirillum saxi]RJF94971.1 zinc-dependent peptidase [Noviherbaspirillum saxi]